MFATGDKWGQSIDATDSSGLVPTVPTVPTVPRCPHRRRRARRNRWSRRPVGWVESRGAKPAISGARRHRATRSDHRGDHPARRG